jgi:ribosome-associated toxin RatA of RatAB toxin-antitoxin module
VDAPIHDVYTVVADVESYPGFLPGVRRVRRNGDLVEMTVQAGPLELTWTHRATFVEDEKIVLKLVQGPFKKLDGLWSFEDLGGKTAVRYLTDWDLSLTVPGATYFVQRALTANVGQTMSAFKRRIEGLHRQERDG